VNPLCRANFAGLVSVKGRLCYTAHMMDMKETDDWIAQAESRGLGGVLNAILDVLAPLGPLGAQLLYIVQPAARMIGWNKAVGDIAELLEEPDGVERLRQRLQAASLKDEECSEENDPQ
jgi:hypothetical protein